MVTFQDDERCNAMKLKDLDNISIIGLGLLGGSLGLAINRVFPKVRRSGYSHRRVTRDKALRAGVIDAAYPTVAEAVRGAQLVVLASPIGTFAELMKDMADALEPGCVVTDVGSTKVLPVRWAKKYLPKKVEFIGSHPMAGSEQRGVDFARADLFDGAHCIITPTKQTKKTAVGFLLEFWRTIGMRISQATPLQHDRVLARISHLPHVLAMTLVNCSDSEQMLLCGKGFLDTTRIASGPPGLWRDILMGNAANIEAAIGQLIKELERVQKALRDGNEKTILKKLNGAQSKRNELIEKKLMLRELPGS